MKYTRRNVYLPDSMWKAMVRAAKKASEARGQPVSATAMIREALHEWLAKAEEEA